MVKRPYSGYVREALTYFSYPFRPKRDPMTKFLIFTFGRSGSNLLVSLLDSHPMISCNSELLLKRVLFPKQYLKCKERLGTKSIYGFKLLSSHFRIQKIPNPREFFNSLYQDGYSIISLRRRNAFRQSISHLYAEHRGKFHHFRDSGEQKFNSMRLDLEALQNELDLVDELLVLEDSLLAQVPYLRLYYEDDLQDAINHQATVDRVCEYIGIPTAPVTTNLIKTTPEDLTEIIENYAELEAFISGTRFEGNL